MDTCTFDSFTLDVEEFDAISFVKCSDGYLFNVMKIQDKQNDYILTDMGYKFTMMMKGPNDTLEINDAILGDPIRIMKNFIKTGSEGIFVKRCKFADNIVNKIIDSAKSLNNAVGDLKKNTNRF